MKTKTSGYIVGLGITLGALLVASLFGLVIWYSFWLHFVEQYKLGFVYDKYTGQIIALDHTGWVVATPWRKDVHSVDLRPSQVCMNANQRVLNCKLVRFNPTGLSKFVEWHGRAAGDSDYQLYEILKSYAFNVNEGRDCPFLTILDDMRKKD